MDGRDRQKDFGWQQALPEGAVAVNGRVWFQDVLGLRAVFVDQAPFYSFAMQDEVENRFTAAQLVEAELASVSEVCQAFSLTPRTFSRSRRQMQRGGVEALVKEKRGPHGRRPKRGSCPRRSSACMSTAKRSTRSPTVWACVPGRSDAC